MELPHVQTIYEKLHEEHPDFQVLAVEINNDRDGADEFIAEHGLTFIFASADRDFVGEKFNTAYYPNTFLIGRDSRIKQHHVGFRESDAENLEREILELLQER